MSDFHECCEAVLASPKANAYAKAYAATGLSFKGLFDGRPRAEFERVQALYILSNLSHWRAPEAKDIKARLCKIGEAR